MKQTGHLKDSQALTCEMLRKLLKEKFDAMDYKQAKADIISFIKDPSVVAPWSNHFFNAISERILCADFH